MSKRVRHAKYLRRKEARKPLSGRVDLIDWVKTRAGISTGRAEAVIRAGSLMADSHVIGVKEFKPSPDRSVKLFDRYVPSELRGRIRVITPEVLKDA